MKCACTAVTLLAALIPFLRAAEVFVEAESFESAGGWEKVDGPLGKAASGLALLGGATGAKDGVATKTVSIKDAGHYRIWVRYKSNPRWRGPFHVTALAGGRELADGVFDTAFEGKSARETETWRSFEADLPEGDVTLRLSKHGNQNSGGPSRLVDCVLLTMDLKLVPNHLHFGAQTFVRVRLGEGYERPAYIHIFADHFHAPWYQHWSLGAEGAVAAIAPKRTALLKSGDATPWCNITPTIYQDSGAMLHITARHTYTEYADRLRATFEFATAPDEKSVVRRLEIDNQPGTVAIFAPPNLLTPEHVALLKTDREIAEATGKIADTHPWPRHGKPREKFPFFVTESISDKFTPPDRRVLEREQRTLDYMGFTPSHLRHIGGAWLMKDGSYCNPDIGKMREKFARAAEEFRKEGGEAKGIVFCELTDEPTGQPLEFCAKDPAYAARFREWLRAAGKSPQDLRVKDWDAVRMVTDAERATAPALYYWSQLFRTRALGDFMAAQRRLAEEAYGGSFPVLVNFSDGAVYTGNFYTQGVDYFELLDSPDQNAIWGEDWSNGASTYQCASFNVDLMRAAARERGQVIAHHLVAHANRKAWDVKLKATSETARGVKILNSFCYGPVWATHEGGPYWRSHVWQSRPELWTAHAALTREIGAVEDLLLPAMPAPAKVALLHSSASDVWTVGSTNAFGFDRMHLWLAFAHAQTPVDIVGERQVARGMLDGYRVCHLTGPNLARAASVRLREWVRNGGILVLSAGAAERDEFNERLEVLDEILPANRAAVEQLQTIQASGRYLSSLVPKDEARWDGGGLDVLAVRQMLAPKPGATVAATLRDGSPALVHGTAGKGGVWCAAFLPGLAYIKPALDRRAALQKKVDEKAPLNAAEQAEALKLERSYNPLNYPGDVRDLILSPARAAGIEPPVRCSHALVDAVFMPGERGIVIPLANYTLEPIAGVDLKVSVPRRVSRIESAVHGAIAFEQSSPDAVSFSLPLGNNDFLQLVF